MDYSIITALVSVFAILGAAIIRVYKMSNNYTDLRIKEVNEKNALKFEAFEKRFGEFKEVYSEKIEPVKEEIKELKKEIKELRNDSKEQSGQIIKLLTTMTNYLT